MRKNIHNCVEKCGGLPSTVESFCEQMACGHVFIHVRQPMCISAAQGSFLAAHKSVMRPWKPDKYLLSSLI